MGALRGEQSNTSLRFGDALILKLFRRLQYGPNPDVEIGWFLTEHTAFDGHAAGCRLAHYVSPEGDQAALALLQQFVVEPRRRVDHDAGPRPSRARGRRYRESCPPSVASAHDRRAAHRAGERDG